MYLSSVPQRVNRMSVISPRYSLSSATSASGVRPSEIVVKERISLNMMVSSFDSPPALKYFLGSCSISRMTPGET